MSSGATYSVRIKRSAEKEMDQGLELRRRALLEVGPKERRRRDDHGHAVSFAKISHDPGVERDRLQGVRRGPGVPKPHLRTSNCAIQKRVRFNVNMNIKISTIICCEQKAHPD